MRKAILAGALGVLTAASFALPQLARADEPPVAPPYNGTCPFPGTVLGPFTDAGADPLPEDPDTVVVGVCVGGLGIPVPGPVGPIDPDGPGGVPAIGPYGGGFIQGGAVEAGATLDNGPTRSCVGSNYVDTTPNHYVPVAPNPGAFVVVDGDNGNTDPLDGYIGVSNYESGASNENCGQANNGNGSNSGGSVGVDNQPATQVPLPIACGNTSGNNFNGSGRDGCYEP